MRARGGGGGGGVLVITKQNATLQKELDLGGCQQSSPPLIATSREAIPFVRWMAVDEGASPLSLRRWERLTIRTHGTWVCPEAAHASGQGDESLFS